MASSYQDFTERLSASGIINPSELQSVEDSLSPEKKAKDALALSLELIRLEKITPFQAGVLFGDSQERLILGNYILLDKLGAGGMGTVYKAQHRRGLRRG